MANQLPEEDNEEKSFLEEHRGIVALGAILLIGGVVVVFANKPSSGPSKPKPPPEMQMIKLMPPPPPPPPKLPPPPPPPSLTPPPKQEMVEQEPVKEEEKPPEAAPEAPPAELSIDAAGTGPGDSFGLVGRPGGKGGTGGNQIGGTKGGSRYGWYAGQVQSVIQEALLKNEKTRQSHIRVEVRIWADSNARVTRATLGGSTGDAALDRAIIQDVLTGLKLKEPPPADMPMPIVMRVTAKRPG